MNKTFTINLAGIVFHIDDDAFDKLQNYLAAVKRSLKNTQGRDEIIADIESRIAELFSAKISEQKQVITLSDVDEIIQIMGQPEDYNVDESIFDEESNSSKSHSSSSSKRLYRDTDDKIIGGVCSGMGQYLKVDPVWIRIFFLLLLFFGVSVIVYIVLWIVIPEAKTTAQKLEMQGEAPNLSNIEKKVKEGFEKVKKKVDDIDFQEVEGKVKQTGGNFLNLIKNIFESIFIFIGKVIEIAFKIIVKLIGVIILIITFALLFVFFIVFILSSLIHINIGNDIIPFHVRESLIVAPEWLSSILLFLTLGIPIFMLLTLAIKLVFSKLKSLSIATNITLFWVWLISVLTLIIIGLT